MGSTSGTDPNLNPNPGPDPHPTHSPQQITVLKPHTLTSSSNSRLKFQRAEARPRRSIRGIWDRPVPNRFAGPNPINPAYSTNPANPTNLQFIHASYPDPSYPTTSSDLACHSSLGWDATTSSVVPHDWTAKSLSSKCGACQYPWQVLNTPNGQPAGYQASAGESFMSYKMSSYDGKALIYILVKEQASGTHSLLSGNISSAVVSHSGVQYLQYQVAANGLSDFKRWSITGSYIGGLHMALIHQAIALKNSGTRTLTLTLTLTITPGHGSTG